MKTGLSRRCIPAGGEPGSPTPGGPSRPGKNLLDSLLAKGVVYADIRGHGLLKKEVKYLYLNDVITREDFTDYMKKIQTPKSTRYRRLEKLEGRCDGVDIPAVFAFANPRKYELFLYMIRNPSREKADGPEDHVPVEGVAKELGVSNRYIRRLMNKVDICFEGGKISTYEVKHLSILILIEKTKKVRGDWGRIRTVLSLLDKMERAEGVKETRFYHLSVKFYEAEKDLLRFFSEVVRD